MGKDFKKTLITILLIAAIGIGLWCGLKWFGETASNNASDDPTGGYEQRVEDEAE
ncbi:MAG: hypothetical protein IJ071_09505 [Ruminococcus sp.]|nr:hypothetical protein [Ruminococcus sp.]